MTLTREEVQALLEGITPGEWHRNIKPATKYLTVWAGRNTHVARVVRDGLSEEAVEANISIIAQAPTLARQLIATLDDLAALKRENERLRKLLRPFAYEAKEWTEVHGPVFVVGDIGGNIAEAKFTIEDLVAAAQALFPLPMATEEAV
jgi:hypothetical protein